MNAVTAAALPIVAFASGHESGVGDYSRLVWRRSPRDSLSCFYDR